ncbi:glycosyltransferase family 2 protein [Bacillus sp. AFS040349]|uniref:glycosyltransferase family 2 protein n=1 Tax=Bacillus sp. AFS040349 TaxID=2033502 RepID=UPI000BFE451A|nr:glycosyltransferase family 2 protein [Bacillus sp. AFS040349]PGT89048.1 hypothetical protein COD11_05065 [Bacillus sp. AFS040349]
MKGLISIIVPVFNSEEFLPSCLKSILSQSYTNIELILINDGSTDKSLSICQEFEEKDKRIRVINQENKGVSNARNVGIEIATGEYLVFIDSDDFLENNMVEKMYKSINSEIDMVICGYAIHDLNFSTNMNENILSIKSNKTQTLNVEDIAKDFWEYYDKGVINPLWNKIYKSSIIKKNSLRFPINIPMGEDGYFNLLYLKHSKKIIIINQPLYHYIQYPSQSSRRVFDKYFSIMMENFNIIESFISKHNGFSNKKNGYRHSYEVFKVIKDSIIHIVNGRETSLKKKYSLVEVILINTRVKNNLEKLNVYSFRDRIFLYLLRKKHIKSLLFSTRIMLILKGS